jgi:hypothetical protein
MTATMEWTAANRIYIDIGHIGADWRTTPNAGRRVAFMNRCLCIFYKAIENIENNEDFSHGRAMRRELDALASAGAGWSDVSDFNEALTYLDSHSLWTDNGTSRYEGGNDKIFPYTVEAPSAFVNFGTGLDEKMARLASDFRVHANAAESATANADTGSWDACRGNLERIKTVADRVKDFLWLMDAAALGASREVQEFMSTTSRYLGTATGTAGKFVDIVGRIDAVARHRIEMQQATSGVAGAEGIVNAFTIFRATVDFLPVLGGFYAQALDAAPGLISSFRRSLEFHLGRADRASRGLDPTPPQPPLCSKCMVRSAHPCF